ncbi:MAG: DegV family protein [Erysipelotrichaceae bacterium]|nr:DegV family protein [Erysipelotrichaceae bacterium]
MNEYQIFTDATADLNEELMQGLPEVKIIPMEIRIDQAPYIYGPGGNIDHELFYSILDTQKEVMTSGINPEVYESYFEEALKEGKDVLYICFTSGLSSTYNTARIIVRELDEKYPDRKIYCLNSYCASIGEAFIVYEAAKRQAEGMGFDELIDYIHNERFNVSHWFTLDNFDYLLKGGRISPAVAAIASALQIKPLLSVDEEGKLYVPAKTRGRKSSIATILKKIDSDWKPEKDKTIIVGHGNCPEEAEAMKEKILAHHPEATVYIMRVGPVIGCHTGPSILAAVFYR